MKSRHSIVLCAMAIILSVACSLFSRAPRPLQFEPDSLPGSQVDVPYETKILITQTDTPVGGVSISKGALPAGLELISVGAEQNTAEIRGTPQEAGTFTFTVSVWCYGLNTRGGQTGEKEYTLVVEE